MLLMTCGMFGLMGLGLFLLPKVGPPTPAAPTPIAGPAAAVEPKPEGVVAGLLAVAPQAGGPGAVPWAPLALAGRKETFHLLDDAELNKVLADLKSHDPNVVTAAAQKLAKATPAPGRRKETAAALLAAMGNPFPSAKEAAAKGLAVWETADDMPALIQMLADPFPDVREAAMTALAGLKNERAAAAVAARLSDFFDREKARQALESMGPVAEPAVLPLLNAADAQTRVEACAVLKAVGTKKSVPALEKASGDPDLNVARAAAEALQAVRARP
jgi:HEAT repeat protein